MMMDPLALRVAARFADQQQVALTFPREFHLPKDLRDKPHNVDPEGTDAAIWTYEVTDGSGKVVPYGIAFVGKQNKPLWHHRFRDEASRKRMIDETIKSRKDLLERKKKQQEERKNFSHGIQVGEIYYTSWGYDQTNIDFYEVTEIRGKDIIVRPVAEKEVSVKQNITYVAAVPGKYVGPAMRARPTPGYGGGASFKVEGHYAHKWDGKPVYETTSGWGH